jgi:molybdate transport system substrate-binding protein
MKKLLFLALALCLVFSLAACAAKTPGTSPSPDVNAEPVTLNVFAAASMTEAMNKIIENYKAAAPNVTIVPTYESSGTLLTQIQEGAEADIFISAAQKQMNTLADDNGIIADTRFDLVKNEVVLVVPNGNPKNIKTFDDAAKADLIALGNSDVPVGQYSEEIFTSMGVWDSVKAKATLGSNVKEVTSWVSEGTVDCGVVYATDAFSAGLEVVAANPPAGTLKTPVLYPAAVLADSANADAAKAFLDYLQTDASGGVFAEIGFSKP